MVGACYVNVDMPWLIYLNNSNEGSSGSPEEYEEYEEYWGLYDHFWETQGNLQNSQTLLTQHLYFVTPSTLCSTVRGVHAACKLGNFLHMRHGGGMKAATHQCKIRKLTTAMQNV